VGDGERPDRVAWHLGMVAVGPDEAVAARLEQAAGRARDRGGYAATVTFLSRAAELSPDEGPRARRLLAAAEAALIAGQPVRAGALLEEATPKLGDPLARAQARRLQGTIRLALGQAGEASSILLEAARAFEPADVRGTREALLEALVAALYVGWSASQTVLLEIADAARALPVAGGASAADMLLDGFAGQAAAGYTVGVPLFRRAIAMLGAGDLRPQEGLRWLALGCAAAADLFDDQAQHALAIRLVQVARDQGALTMLPVALVNQSMRAEVVAGRFDASRACFTEASEISAATGNPGVVGTAGLAEVYELAWRGRETDARRAATAVTREATGAGRGSHSIWVQYCLVVLELGLGNYQAALQCALGVFQDDGPGQSRRWGSARMSCSRLLMSSLRNTLSRW
jgi:tetratricopeptide (TPR) repeat protein